MPSLSAFAGDPEAYVVYKNGTLTFKYNDQKPEGAYALNNGPANAPWNSYISQVTTVVFDNSFKNCKPKSCSNWFYGGSNITKITGMSENLNTEDVTQAANMFRGCEKLSSIDLSNFNTAKFERMDYMFQGCSNLKELDLTKFNTAQVYTMQSMFQDCSNLKTIYVSDKWSVASLKHLENMFKDCGTDEVTKDDRVAYVVYNNGTLTFKYDNNKPEGAYAVSTSTVSTANVDWIYVISSVTTVVFDKSFRYYTPNTCSNWFHGGSNITKISGMSENLNTEKVTYTTYMFTGCSKLSSIDFSNFNTENITHMNFMFEGCTSLSELDLTNFNTSKVTTMQSMFDGCTNLRTILVSDKWETSSVEHSENMFNDCSKIKGYKGTTYKSDKIDKTYANIDKGESDPGYLSIKLELVSISITTQPSKTEYICGQELDLSDGVLTANFDDGSKTTISLSNLEVSGFDPQTIGEQTIKLSYKGKEVSLTIKVIERVAESITIDPLPTKTEYIKGEALDLAGGKLVVTFNDNTTETIDLSEATVSGFDSQKVAEQTITVKYNELSNTFSVTVKEEQQTENPPTPVSETPGNQDNVKVWSCSSTIYIESAPDTKYKIIDLNGRTLTTATTKSTREEITVNTHNIVLVLVDGKSYKVYVK